ncbi:Retrovirus-related Pol polyprotein [Arachis hypogaea]|nr:uncharacterized protein LOC114924289 [Arachis hypogaea]QHO29140.1 Retrovirus-related Pol polyprotein [Arachis hypogaea]
MSLFSLMKKLHKSLNNNSDADKTAGKASNKHQEWLLQDYNLSSWLSSSMDDAFKNRMVYCTLVHQIWNRLQQYFIFSNKTKMRKCKAQLKNVKKMNFSATDYLAKTQIGLVTWTIADQPMDTVSTLVAT